MFKKQIVKEPMRSDLFRVRIGLFLRARGLRFKKTLVLPINLSG